MANEQSAERDLQKTSSNTLQRPTIDVAGQRTSLPDIPLTPRYYFYLFLNVSF